MNPLPSAIVSTEYPVMDGPPQLFLANEGLGQPAGRDVPKAFGNFKAVLPVPQMPDQPSEKGNPSPHVSFPREEDAMVHGPGIPEVHDSSQFPALLRDYSQVPLGDDTRTPSTS